MLDTNTSKVVIIDDEKYICSIITEALGNEQYSVTTFSNAEEGLEYIRNNYVDLVLTDLVMGEYNGVQVVDTTLENHRDAIVILMTAHPTVETAISVLKKGAYDFLVKPFKLDLLRASIKRGLTHQRIIRENLRLKEQVAFLQVAQAGVFEEDTGSFMKLVVNSCKKELGASAVAMMQLNPHSGQMVREIHDCDREEFREHVLNKDSIKEFLNNPTNQPKIEKQEVEINGVCHIKTFITQPIFVRRTLYGVINVLVVDRFGNLTSGQMDILTLLSTSAATTLANFGLYDDLEKSYFQAFSALANAIEARDPYTAGHTDRVSTVAELVAAELQWENRRLRLVRMGCTLHDIGKIGVPDSILNKTGRLTDEEKDLMNSHPELGLKIINGIDLFTPAIPYIASHHEWYDGSGYPEGLAGEQIPIEGRLLTVVDTFDAIMSDRPYRKGSSLKDTLEEIVKFSGTQFDPDIVDALLRVIRKGLVDFNSLYGRDEDITAVDQLRWKQKVSV